MADAPKTERVHAPACRRPRGPAEVGRARVVVEDVAPCVDGGRFPIKRVAGEEVAVEADVFADGHGVVRAEVLHAPEGAQDWQRVAMRALGNDRWRGAFRPRALGRHLYCVRGWIDPFATWLRDLEKRVAAGQELEVELRIGAELLRGLAQEAEEAAAERALAPWCELLEDAATPADERAARALEAELGQLAASLARPHAPETFERWLCVLVEPTLARFSAWYELFPRSAAAEPGRHGTLRDVEARLDYVAELGFDILYLPPIHPIGTTYRKGPNNALEAGPGDPGSPWAIGSPAGGHTAVHPELGTLEDVTRLAERARARGIALALDVAFQTSPDHPWVREHPDWFRRRPDGTIQYAENPPKKYQDIYPIDFESERTGELWEGLRDVFEFWIERGVHVFRVDNPHTKSLHFWEWCLDDLKSRHPQALFLSEAFTRPKLMRRLAKAGFTQSYTYFPWRNTKEELTEYLTELSRTEVREYLRPSQWTNTPDILTEYLQVGGRAAFLARLYLAATLGASYGIYGPAFELCEGRALREGSEEYLDSEKYQLREWKLDDPRSLRAVVARLNRVRRANPALQQDRTLLFHETDNDEILCYSKHDPDGTNVVLVVVNLDPHHLQRGWLWLDLHPLGLSPGEGFQVHDLVSDARFLWRGESNFVELDPAVVPGHVFAVRRRSRSERDFDYYL